MMNARRLASLTLFSLLASSACATGHTDPKNRNGVDFEKGGIVLSGQALMDGRGPSWPPWRVRSPTSACTGCPGMPRDHAAQSVNFKGAVNPHVYVDGTRTTDTCVLDSLRTTDVERVEVYPQGFTTRPGYARTHTA